MNEDQSDFRGFLDAARRGAPTAWSDAPPTLGVATRIAAAWAAEKPAPWWLAPFERAAPWAAAAVVALVLGVAVYVRHDYGPSARLADALGGLVAEEPRRGLF